MASLPDFESDARAALMDGIESELERLMQNFVDVVHNNLQSYARTHGYDVESTIGSVTDVQVDRSSGTVTAKVGWQHPQMSRWEFGTDAHTITPTSADVLSFVWENPPQWVREEFDQARSSGKQYASGWRVFLPKTEGDGLPESRAIRDAMNGLRRLLS